jgi:glycerate dehydrogenase
MIGMPEFRKMKRRPLLINTARGGLVVEEDLVQAVKEGLIAGAGFDCITREPLPADHCFREIMDRPNVIITPHVGWASQEAMQGCWSQVIDNIEGFQAGSPSNVVT